MIAFKPIKDFVAKLLCKCQEFFSVLLRGRSGHIIFHRIPFDATGIEIRGISFAFVAEDQRKCRQCAEMLKILLWTITRSVQQNCAKLQNGVIGDTKLPVVGDSSPGISKVTIDDRQQTRDFLWACLMGPNPPVLLPVLQGHLHLR